MNTTRDRSRGGTDRALLSPCNRRHKGYLCCELIYLYTVTNNSWFSYYFICFCSCYFINLREILFAFIFFCLQPIGDLQNALLWYHKAIEKVLEKIPLKTFEVVMFLCFLVFLLAFIIVQLWMIGTSFKG